MDINFNAIDDFDFENLVIQILNEEEKEKGSDITYRSFKKGKDRGVDFRYSTCENENYIIGQAKHYYNSKFSDLRNSILGSRSKKGEYEKIKDLKPYKYIFATSMSLTLGQVDKVFEWLHPYCRSKNDIIHRGDIEIYLVKYKKIYENNFKLWMGSYHSLKKLFAYQDEARYELDKEYLVQNIKKYSFPSFFNTALKIIKESPGIIISGDPGVGKTALAEMLMYKLILDGYDLVYVESDIDYAIKQLDKKERKVFYFDDFLGANEHEHKRLISFESLIAKFLHQCFKYDNIKLIITSRNYLLGKAIEKYRKLSKSIEKLKVLELDDKLFLKEDKKAILRKILGTKFSSNEENYIINHNNFNCRLLETLANKNETVSRAKVIRSFSNPAEVWKEVYERDMAWYKRIILDTLYTFEDFGGPRLENFYKAFTQRYKYEVSKNNRTPSESHYEDIIRSVDGNFVRIYDYHGQGLKISFANPSLKDYISKRMEEDEFTYESTINSIVYYEQILWHNHIKLNGNLFKHYVPKKFTYLLDRILNNELDCLHDSSDWFDKSHICQYFRIYTLISICGNLEFEEKYYERVGNYNINVLKCFSNYRIVVLLGTFCEVPQYYDIVKKNADFILVTLIEKVADFSDLTMLVEFREKYLENYSLTETLKEAIETTSEIEWIIESYLEDQVDELMTHVTSEAAAEVLIEEIEGIAEIYGEIVDEIITIDTSIFDDVNWHEVAVNNRLNEDLAKD